VLDQQLNDLRMGILALRVSFCCFFVLFHGPLNLNAYTIYIYIYIYHFYTFYVGFNVA
jgi:hypothetical protein